MKESSLHGPRERRPGTKKVAIQRLAIGFENAIGLEKEAGIEKVAGLEKEACLEKDVGG